MIWIKAVQFNMHRFVVKAISRLNRYEKRAKMLCMNVVSGAAGVSRYYGAISPVYYALFPHYAHTLQGLLQPPSS